MCFVVQTNPHPLLRRDGILPLVIGFRAPLLLEAVGYLLVADFREGLALDILQDSTTRLR